MGRQGSQGAVEVPRVGEQLDSTHSPRIVTLSGGPLGFGEVLEDPAGMLGVPLGVFGCLSLPGFGFLRLSWSGALGMFMNSGGPQGCLGVLWEIEGPLAVQDS